MPRRRVLVLAPFPPRRDATHGGGRLVAQAVTALAARHEVGLLALRADGEPPVGDEVAGACALVVEVPRRTLRDDPRALWTERRRIALRAAGRPPWVVSCSVAALTRQLRDVVGSWRPDIVQGELLVMGQYAAVLGGGAPPFVLVDHDAAPEGAGRGQAWRAYARRVARDVAAHVVFTEEDAAIARADAGPSPVVVIPPGFDLPRALDPVGRDAQVLFVGSFVHEPNVEAARRLATSIRPQVVATRPEARFVLVGADPPADLVHAQDETLLVTGAVEDVTAHLDRAAVVVAPIREGGGIRVKVLEAVASGKALVASSRALAGLDVEHDEHVLVADSDAEIAEAVSRLLADDRLRARLGASARAWAEARPGWDAALERYDELYSSLLGGRDRAEAAS